MAVINLNLFSMMLRFGTDVTVVLPDEIQKTKNLPVYGFITEEAETTQTGFIIPTL